VDIELWAVVMSTPGDVLDQVDLAQLLRRPAWHAQAACRGMGTSLFFVDRGGDPNPAKAICATCPVTAECAEASADEQGIWAGVAASRQARAQRERRQPAA
jgi:hypothetical protein